MGRPSLARVISPDFSENLVSAARGDEHAFTVLVQPLIPVLRRFLQPLLRADAEDALSETLIRIHARLGSFEGDVDDFRGWVFTIARNCAVDEHRRRFRWHRAIASSTRDGAPDNVEEEAIRNVDKEVDRVLGMLTGAQREVLLLRVVAGLSVEEAAKVTGRTTSSVKVIQHRALRILKRRLKEGVTE